jgi:hypothetical protein
LTGNGGWKWDGNAGASRTGYGSRMKRWNDRQLSNISSGIPIQKLELEQKNDNEYDVKNKKLKAVESKVISG